MSCMRRVLVIFLILLFPVHVLADLASTSFATSKISPSIAPSEDQTASDKNHQAIFSIVASYQHAPVEPPASAEVQDTVVQHLPLAMNTFLAFTQLFYVDLPEYLLVLPLIKPPPMR